MQHKTKIILATLTEKYSTLNSISESIFEAYQAIVECYTGGGKVMTCGNGGSAADALHIVGELMKGFALPRKLSAEEQIYPEHLNAKLQGSLPAISLVNEVSLMTAFANDMDPNVVFAQQVHGYGAEGDVLIAISTSGNSENIIYAAEVAKAKKIKVVSLSGECGGKLKALSDVAICVPEREAYKVQELHLPIYHALCLAVENEFFGENL